MPSHAVTVLDHRFGNPSGDGSPSHVFAVAFWVDCPPELRAEPVTIALASRRGHEATSTRTTNVRDATGEERAAVADGRVLEFVLDEVGGQHADHVSDDEIKESFARVWSEIVAEVTRIAKEKAHPRRSLIGRLMTDGDVVAVARAVQRKDDAVGRFLRERDAEISRKAAEARAAKKKG
jgi:hypothetical protein